MACKNKIVSSHKNSMKAHWKGNVMDNSFIFCDYLLFRIRTVT